MTNENSISRLAGLLYLIVVATGLFSLAYVPSQITVPGNALATTENIVSHAVLFRFGIAAFMVMQVAFLILPLALYRLFRVVNHSVAAMMVALATVSVPIGLASLMNRLDAVSLLTDASARQAFTLEQLHATAWASLDAYRHGLLITRLFWGLWLLPFGYLVFKSGFLPRLLGVLLMLGCLGYMVGVFGELLVPHYTETPVSEYARLPASIGEISTCLWLLLVGARRTRSSVAQPSVQADRP